MQQIPHGQPHERKRSMDPRALARELASSAAAGRALRFQALRRTRQINAPKPTSDINQVLGSGTALTVQ